LKIVHGRAPLTL